MSFCARCYWGAPTLICNLCNFQCINSSWWKYLVVSQAIEAIQSLLCFTNWSSATDWNVKCFVESRQAQCLPQTCTTTLFISLCWYVCHFQAHKWNIKNMQQKLNEFYNYSCVYGSIYVTLKIETFEILCKNMHFVSREIRPDLSSGCDNNYFCFTELACFRNTIIQCTNCTVYYTQKTLWSFLYCKYFYCDGS